LQIYEIVVLDDYSLGKHENEIDGVIYIEDGVKNINKINE
jgi:hypothetical protein